MSLDEAVALLWPLGPLTVSSLRSAIRRGELGHARIAGKIFTTLRELAELAECARRPPAKKVRASKRSNRRTEASDRYLATLLGR